MTSTLLLLNTCLHPTIIVKNSQHYNICIQLCKDITNIGAATSAKLLICGDMNCPGSDEHSTDVNLSDLFDSFGLKQHVTAPTREGNLLDVLATEDHAAVMDVSVEDVGLVSDHRLVVAKLQGRPHHAERPHTPIATSVR